MPELLLKAVSRYVVESTASTFSLFLISSKYDLLKKGRTEHASVKHRLGEGWCWEILTHQHVLGLSSAQCSQVSISHALTNVGVPACGMQPFTEFFC